MARLLSLCGMTGGFLLISPTLRGDVAFGFSATATLLNNYSPFSYVIIAIGIFALLTMGLYKTAR